MRVSEQEDSINLQSQNMRALHAELKTVVVRAGSRTIIGGELNVAGVSGPGG